VHDLHTRQAQGVIVPHHSKDSECVMGCEFSSTVCGSSYKFQQYVFHSCLVAACVVKILCSMCGWYLSVEERA
jgi:hypothetical protein